MRRCTREQASTRADRRLFPIELAGVLRAFGAPVIGLHRFTARASAQLFQLVIVRLFNPDVSISGFAGPNDFVELRPNGGGVPVLGVLKKKYHQECDDACASIDDELPRVRITKQWSSPEPKPPPPKAL